MSHHDDTPEPTPIADWQAEADERETISRPGWSPTPAQYRAYRSVELSHASANVSRGAYGWCLPYSYPGLRADEAPRKRVTRIIRGQRVTYLAKLPREHGPEEYLHSLTTYGFAVMCRSGGYDGDV